MNTKGGAVWVGPTKRRLFKLDFPEPNFGSTFRVGGSQSQKTPPPPLFNKVCPRGDPWRAPGWGSPVYGHTLPVVRGRENANSTHRHL